MVAKGSAKYTSHVHLVAEPAMVEAYRAHAQQLGVDVSVVYRWALKAYAEKEMRFCAPDSEPKGETGASPAP